LGSVTGRNHTSESSTSNCRRRTQCSNRVTARRGTANTFTDIRCAKRYRKIAKLHRELANLYDQEADEGEEDKMEVIEVEDDSEEMEE
jgi:hypothetical protein